MSEQELANIREAYADADVRNAAGPVIADIDVLLAALEHTERALAQERTDHAGLFSIVCAERGSYELLNKENVSLRTRLAEAEQRKCDNCGCTRRAP